MLDNVYVKRVWALGRWVRSLSHCGGGPVLSMLAIFTSLPLSRHLVTGSSEFFKLQNPFEVFWMRVTEKKGRLLCIYSLARLAKRRTDSWPSPKSTRNLHLSPNKVIHKHYPDFLEHFQLYLCWKAAASYLCSPNCYLAAIPTCTCSVSYSARHFWAAWKHFLKWFLKSLFKYLHSLWTKKSGLPPRFTPINNS